VIPSLTRHRVLRSWPWTIALAAVAGAVLLVGLLGFSARSSLLGLLLSLITIAAALLALFRVLTSGVYVLPTGLIIRELTRSTPVPWARIKSITTATTGRRGAHAPVLVVMPAPGTPKSAPPRIEVTILASYHESVAKRRADELAAARAAAGKNAPGRS
jgi:hypothetical protein